MIIAAIALAMAGASPVIQGAETVPSPINALYVLTLPQDYEAFEEFIASVKDSGADTIIIKPLLERGRIDKQRMAKAVFFAHNAGFRLFVILPTRSMTFMLKDHADWEDLYYDVGSGTIQPAGKLDVFNPDVVASIVEQIKDIAGYSVDGILLDEDFNYGPAEGMSPRALEQYKQKYSAAFPARTALADAPQERGPNQSGDEYGEAFWNMAELKNQTILQLFKEIVQAARSVNGDVRFGVPLPIQGLFLEGKNLMARHSHDVKNFKKMDVHFFWLAVPHRDSGQLEHLNYKKRIEYFSRTAVSAVSLVNDPAKVIIGIQTSSRTGRDLALSEIEEIAKQAKKAGEPGIALMLRPSTRLPTVFTKKIFRRQPV
jgi:hypothetical protein